MLEWVLVPVWAKDTTIGYRSPTPSCVRSTNACR